MPIIAEFLRQHALIAVFLTVGLGFLLGRLRFKSFALGPVAATLIVGVAFGQLRIAIPDMVKTVFFLFFLFSLGYSVGPQFFRSFRGNGLRLMLFALVLALICAGTVILAAALAGYNNGIAAGLFAGSQTASASLGLLADTVRGMSVEGGERDYLLTIIPACYAVTYVFGTIGSAWYLSVMGPKLLGGFAKVKAEADNIEQTMDGGGSDNLTPGQIRAGRPVEFRAYTAENDTLFGEPQTAGSIEQWFAGKGFRVVVERVKSGDRIIEPEAGTTISRGDTVVLGARSRTIIEAGNMLGPEKADAELLNFGNDKTPVTVSHSGAAGLTLGQLRGKDFMNGVIIASLKRNGLAIPIRNLTTLHPGDVLTLVGFPRDIAEAAKAIGYADAQTTATDMVFVGLGIAAGCILGSLAIKVGGIPLSAGVSGGTLISGLVLGWLRNRKPSFGHIPAPVLWLFSNLGLNMFIAIVGITAGASFLHGINEAGFMIFPIGLVCTIATLTAGIWLGHKVFGFSAPETLGCVAGARCSVAAIGAVVDRLDSTVPNLGYTVCYAVANITLVFSSLLVLFCV